MSEVVKRFGQRVKYYRTRMGVSQEKFAELCGLHPTYIGQVERGEKNCTLESAEKISKGLNIPLETLLCKSVTLNEEDSILHEIYDAVSQLDDKTQKDISEIIRKVIEIKKRRS